MRGRELMTAVGPATVVLLHPLAIAADDDEAGTFVVGRRDGGQYVELPDVGVRALRLLDAGLTGGAVEERLADGDERPDVGGFVEELVELDWVAVVDGRELPDPLAAAGSHLAWLRPGHVRWLFGRTAAACYGALVLAAIVTVVARPALLPAYEDFFWTDYVGLATFGNMLMIIGGSVVHELMHLAAARSLGVPGRIGFGTRLYSLALQTDVTAAWALPPRRRLRIYLAGMAWDSAAIAAAILLCAYANPPATIRALLAAYVVIALVGLVFQCQFFMRTDVYFVLMDVLRCRDLFGDGLRYARYLLARAVRALRRRPAPANPIDGLRPREARGVRIYAPLVVLGSTAALAAFALVGIPILVETSVRAGAAVVALRDGGSVLHAVDGGVVLAVVSGLQILFIRTFVRSHPAWFARGSRPTEGGELRA